MSSKNEQEEKKQPDEITALSERQILRDFFDLLLKVDARLQPELYRPEKPQSTLSVKEKINNNQNDRNTNNNNIK